MARTKLQNEMIQCQSLLNQLCRIYRMKRGKCRKYQAKINKLIDVKQAKKLKKKLRAMVDERWAKRYE